MSANALASLWRQNETSKPEQLLARAVRLFKEERFEAAIYPLEEYLELQPEHFEAVHLRAEIALRHEDYDGAIKGFTHAIRLKPLSGQGYYNLAQTLHKQEKHQQALRLYEMAQDLDYLPLETMNNRGLVLRDLHRIDDALALYDQLLEQDPFYLHAYINRSTTLLRQHRVSEAIADCDKALSIDPSYIDAWHNRGFCLGEALNYPEAHTSYLQALARDPHNKKIKFAESLLLLAQGEFAKGWWQYESRFEDTSLGLKKPQISAPEWDGKTALQGKRIIVHIEQGLGDILQFCRFVPRLADMGATVWFVVPASLQTLMESLGPRVQIATSAEGLEADYWVTLLSLPFLLSINDERDFGTSPYLCSSQELQIKWQAQLGQHKGPRIGLAWSGNTTHRNDHNRSLSLAALLPHLPTGLEYVVVQKDLRDEDAALLASQTSHTIRRLAIDDFADTAALCQNLDLVISVDTSVAHLTGAVGCPLWLLLPFNPDFRWQLGRSDSPWYGQCQLLRQPSYGDWNSVLTTLGQRLQSEFLGGDPVHPV